MADTATAAVRTLRNRWNEDVPVTRIRATDVLKNDTVDTMIGRAIALQELMIEAKKQAFAEIDAYLNTLRDKYRQPQQTGAAGGMTLESFDQLRKVTVSSANTIRLGPEIQVAREMINACIKEWSQGANEHIQTLVDNAFKVGRDGKLSVDRVLALRQVEIKDAAWEAAMVALNDAIQVSGSRLYIRFYTRKKFDAPWEQITLDLSGL